MVSEIENLKSEKKNTHGQNQFPFPFFRTLTETIYRICIFFFKTVTISETEIDLVEEIKIIGFDNLISD